MIREGLDLIYSLNLRLPTRFVILDKELDHDDGELTATQQQLGAQSIGGAGPRFERGLFEQRRPAFSVRERESIERDPSGARRPRSHRSAALLVRDDLLLLLAQALDAERDHVAGLQEHRRLQRG